MLKLTPRQVDILRRGVVKDTRLKMILAGFKVEDEEQPAVTPSQDGQAKEDLRNAFAALDAVSIEDRIATIRREGVTGTAATLG